MRENDKAVSGKRRAFLKLVGLGGVVGAAAAVAAPGAAKAAEPDKKAGGGYRETAHVKKAYDLARF